MYLTKENSIYLNNFLQKKEKKSEDTTYSLKKNTNMNKTKMK